MEYLNFFVTMAGTLGGCELVKVLLSRRNRRRMEGAQAAAEEFHALREYNDFLQQQLRDASERHAEQTALIRSLNAEILDLTRHKCTAEAELALKRCERRACPQRQPQSGF